MLLEMHSNGCNALRGCNVIPSVLSLKHQKRKKKHKHKKKEREVRQKRSQVGSSKTPKELLKLCQKHCEKLHQCRPHCPLHAFWSCQVEQVQIDTECRWRRKMHMNGKAHEHASCLTDRMRRFAQVIQTNIQGKSSALKQLPLSRLSLTAF